MADNRRSTDIPAVYRAKGPRGYLVYILAALAIVVLGAAIWLLLISGGSNVYPGPSPAPTAYAVAYSDDRFDMLNGLVAGMWLNGDGSDRITFNSDHFFVRYLINTSKGNQEYSGQWSIENSQLYICHLKYDATEYEEGLQITIGPDGTASGQLVPLCSAPESPLPAKYGYEKHAA